MKRFSRLIFGLFLYALGITITIKADIGFAPWDVFHVGLADTISTTVGIASIYAVFAIVIIALLLGEKLGIGTIMNMFAIGLFIDLIMYLDIIPQTSHLMISVLMLLTGLVIISFGSYYYMGSGFGAGPRDSLMVGLNKKTKLPIGLCRGLVEITAVIIGWFLGGKVGIGTLIAAFSIGPIIQTTFSLLKFDTALIEHETLHKTWQLLRANK